MIRPWLRTRRGWRWGLVFLVLVAGFVGFGSPSRLPPLPDPNGYDDLVRAGREIRGVWPNNGDWTKADVGTLQAFAIANDTALRTARTGLARAGMAHFADSHQGLSQLFDQQAQVRSLARLLLAEARLAQEAGRHDDLARIDLEVLELGQMATQGSTGVAATMGWVVQGQALDQLRTLRGHLDPRTLRLMISRLERLDQRRVPLEETDARFLRWYNGAFPVWQRLIMRVNGVEATGHTAEQNLVRQSHDRIERSMRFLLVEWAIVLFRQENGRWPRSVAELVPSVLAAVPIDPSTNQPLVYPANPAGELTDDLSAIGQPDGSTGPAIKDR